CFDFGADGVRFAEDVDLFVAASQPGAESVLGAPADDEDGIASVPDRIPNMVADTAGLGHAGSAEDDAWLLEVVERHGFLGTLDIRDVRHAERVVLAHHHVAKFLI